MDLFDYMREQNKETSGPLASRMRPTTLDEVVGQQHIVGKDKPLYRAIKADKEPLCRFGRHALEQDGDHIGRIFFHVSRQHI